MLIINILIICYTLIRCSDTDYLSLLTTSFVPIKQDVQTKNYSTIRKLKVVKHNSPEAQIDEKYVKVKNYVFGNSYSDGLDPVRYAWEFFNLSALPGNVYRIPAPPSVINPALGRIGRLDITEGITHLIWYDANLGVPFNALPLINPNDQFVDIGPFNQIVPIPFIEPLLKNNHMNYAPA